MGIGGTIYCHSHAGVRGLRDALSLCPIYGCRYFEDKESHDAHKTQGDLVVLREANVVGMTTTGVAMNQALVEALGARIVVIEEAAEVSTRKGRGGWSA